MLSKTVVLLWLLWMSVLDIKSRSVPIWLMAIGGVLVLLFGADRVLQTVGQTNWGDFAWALFGGMIPGMCMLLVAWLTKAVGYGDGVVLTVLGVVLGIQKGFLLLCVSLFLAALGSIVLLVTGRVKRNSCLPFIPFLTVGWFLVGMG